MPMGPVDTAGSANYWAFRRHTKEELASYARGYLRRAYTELKNDNVKWLVAELWRDSRWVTLLGTGYLAGEAEHVRRWTAETRQREDVACSVALRRYNNYMGAIDHFNKLLAATMMSMGRCKQRFHRAMFLSWMLPGVGVLNVRTAFGELIRQQFGSEALDAIMSARGVKGPTSIDGFSASWAICCFAGALTTGLLRMTGRGLTGCRKRHVFPCLVRSSCRLAPGSASGMATPSTCETIRGWLSRRGGATR